ncbi:group I truncated hemoglobin [Caulobacter sp. DWR1-3-2b1]|uniref:group I truncated hemoglobin n=1 Tax=Caulobacter sp. DWR1-3-2b1 TaxID=2804670 RepID=UPI003CE9F4AE
MRHFTKSAALAAVITLGLTGAALAQDPVPPGEKPVDPYAQSNANAGARPMDDTKVFGAFHGKDGLTRIAADTVDRSLADPRIKDVFATTDVPRLKRTLAEQFCYVLGGGCAYTGRDMASVHKDMGVTNKDFNALVENLQWAMEKEGVPFFAQNKLLAKLAPMQRGVVER